MLRTIVQTMTRWNYLISVNTESGESLTFRFQQEKVFCGRQNCWSTPSRDPRKEEGEKYKFKAPSEKFDHNVHIF